MRLSCSALFSGLVTETGQDALGIDQLLEVAVPSSVA